jgi:hypothetical protein
MPRSPGLLSHLVTLTAASLAAAAATSLIGCGPSGGAPQIDPINDQTAYVASEFTLEVRASDPQAGGLDFDFDSDIDGLEDRAEIRIYGDGSSAVFRWTPLAQDVGVHYVDFQVSNGGGTTTETVSIEVMAAESLNNAPIFRQPLGTGTTLDLSAKACLELDVVVEDSDTAEVTIAQEQPVIEGATLEVTGGLTATWNWCPTAEQIEAQDRYGLTLAADDGSNPKTIKNYLIVLRRAPKPDCPGGAPVVTHTPGDESTLVGLTITADISDDVGLKSDPLFYYSASDPGATPDLGQMTQLTMILLSGDSRNGTWGADVPNPVASMPAGSMATLYYVIVAQDNDDDMGDCDHITQGPDAGAFSMTVTNPGGSGGLGLCETCTADVQCGDGDDNCVRVGTTGSYFCGRNCTADAECGAGYYCSVTMLSSIDGVAARQCIPDDFSCDTGGPGPTTCSDDTYEDNDTRTQASAEPALPPGTYSLTSCPDGSFADDEDWFKVTITGDSNVTVSITGGSATDLDLSLVDNAGATVVVSNGLTSSESVATCLEAGTYFIRVYAFGTGENDYTLTWSKTTTSSCAGSCSDDSEEPDDNYMASRRVDDTYPYTSDTNAICADDDDWFRVNLFSGETIHVTLAFTQSTASEDLDIHFYQGTTDLTPCSPASPSTCDSSNGQDGDSNENMTYTVTSSGYYYVVVRGWDGSENLYDICIGLSDADCPPLAD